MTTAFVHDPASLEHLTGPGHPERPERVSAILERLTADGLLAELDVLEASPADVSALQRVHTRELCARIERSAAEGFGILDAEDTTISRGSWRAALGAAGAALAAVDQVQSGAADNAFALCRPPGHHAERGRAMGFCLANNVAIAAEHLRQTHGLQRVAILDWDVHHGNGTQHLFEEDPDIFYASLHQWPHYPGTGAVTERGRGAGDGATLNCPLEAGTGDREWLTALEGSVLPAFEQFAPEFILISAGFDAHELDPLSATRVSTATYATFTERVRELAQRVCGGKLVSLLEGGYHLDALASSVAAHLGALRS